ncbi:bifunctional phosphoribosyl-AMP cyclohydrolase/phosphoribosyl-ATP diphosphatase HisIE [uncultured Merdimonas sp.]|uniref:bifunctional phosphoribosyl-AMP cyclohydrolase/phosphoribosyl-ATP diphosphatase HisIE n=1 Tax=uncultured Merdimonas sp. TaxID=2023269 RepID=UPI00320B5C6F
MTASYKRLIPCILIAGGKAVTWFDDKTPIAEDVIGLAKYYSDHGADELIVFDLSDSDEEHEEAIDLMKRINRIIRIPMIAGGNVKRQEDVKKILYAGAKRAIINFSRQDSPKLMEDAAKRFGKEKIAVSLQDFDALFKHQHLIEECCGEIVFMHRLDLDSVMNVTDIPCVILTDTMEESELYKILKAPGVKGLSGRYVSRPDMDFHAFKEKCSEQNIKMTSFESIMEFSQFKTNEQGLIPVIVQHYKTQEVLMLAYMNEEAFNQTIKTGRMTYYSRSRQSLWVKGETSGHFQYVKSLTIDCDLDTLLAKVDQVGAACHTGNPTCFFQPLAGTDYDENNPLKIFESVYNTILDRKENPKEGSYTNYLFDKGIDKILKKVGEEATEVVIAAKNPNPEEVKYELSDFLYHAMVLMVEKGISWEDIIRELADR